LDCARLALSLHKMTTDEFIQAHRDDDVATLALRCGRAGGIDVPFALEQIASWQTAKRKLPTWAATRGIVFPPRLAMEQCSSEQTAEYKKQLTERLLCELSEAERTSKTARRESTLTDLTGGFGVDFSIMAPLFHSAVYVEKKSELCRVVQNNLPLLGVDNAVVVCDDGVEYLKRMPTTTILYLDPARRDTNGRRTYALSDCTPDVLALLPQLLPQCERLLLKLSPMLDIKQTVADIERTGLAMVAEAHVVAVENECKELLMVVKARGENARGEPLRLFCANDDDVFSVDDLRSLGSLRTVKSLTAAPLLSQDDFVGGYLYEPNAAIMKAGLFAELCQTFAVKQIDGNSHLFVSRQKIDGFPGRRFAIVAATTMRREDIKTVFADVQRANVAVRNFPLTAEQLRKRLRLKDGGWAFVFGTTVRRQHIVLLCRKC